MFAGVSAGHVASKLPARAGIPRWGAIAQRYIAGVRRRSRLLRGPVPRFPPLIVSSEETVSIIRLKIRIFHIVGLPATAGWGDNSKDLLRPELLTPLRRPSRGIRDFAHITILFTSWS